VSARLSEVTHQLLSSQETVSGRLDKAAAVVGEVQRSLGALGQQSQRILEVGQDIAALQEILRAPKLRGTLGELFLGELLGQMLPPAHFELQHRFRSGEIVDAVVRVGDRLVPVDSKFPLENFRRVLEAPSDEERKAARRKFASDVRKHIDAVAGKYILPDEGTYDFALMYIPAENVYYETIVKDEQAGEERSISAYALERRVVPVSPNSIYAYLQVIALGLRGLKVEEQARSILEHLARLQGEVARFTETFEVLGKHLGNAQKSYQETEKRLARLEDKLGSLKEGAPAALPAEVPETALLKS
jgi:DNA recombination protein RmuC